jgi:hypothetical protein
MAVRGKGGSLRSSSSSTSPMLAIQPVLYEYDFSVQWCIERNMQRDASPSTDGVSALGDWSRCRVQGCEEGPEDLQERWGDLEKWHDSRQLPTSRSRSAFDFNTTRHATTMSSPKPTGLMAPQYITGVYIPSAILIIGTAAFKLQWLPIAIAVCAALGGYQFLNNRNNRQSNTCYLDFTNTPLHRAEEGP